MTNKNNWELYLRWVLEIDSINNALLRARPFKR